MGIFSLSEKLFSREYNRLRAACGNMPHALTDQYELQRIAHPYYNSRAEGGEGHLEVAKNIYYSNKDLCHMVLSVKPFGCMPSTQSDGVQSAVTSHFKEIIYLPIETSGEGEINAHSRVQMALGEARARSRAEMQGVLERNGVTLEQLQEYVAGHPELQDPFYPVPKVKGVAGVAARFAQHVAVRIQR
jgi:predicted nucleotide-binding protein (sugar kinase/HSP70/actin superfamily)